MMPSSLIAKKLFNALGGTHNIVRLDACMTRLRIGVRSLADVKLQSIQGEPWLLGCIEGNLEYQFVLGPGNTEAVLEALNALCLEQKGMAEPHTDSELPTTPDERGNTAHLTVVQRFMSSVSNAFVPLVPILIACALLKTLHMLAQKPILGCTLVTVLPNFFALTELLSQTVFDYLHIFVGMNAAKAFGGTPIIGGILGAILYAPGLGDIQWLGKVLVPERGGLIAVLMAAWLASAVEHGLHQRLKGMASLFLTSLLTISTVGLIAITVLQPIGWALSTLLVKGTEYLLNSGTIWAGALLAASFLFFVMSGIHPALLPIHLELFRQQQCNPLFTILCMAGLSQVGVAIGVYQHSHKLEWRNLLRGGILSGLLGIDEPLLFGMSLPLSQTLFSTCLGAAIGGAWIRYWQVASSVPYGITGLTLGIAIADQKAGYYLVGCLISIVSGYAFETGFDMLIRSQEQKRLVREGVSSIAPSMLE